MRRACRHDEVPPSKAATSPEHSEFRAGPREPGRSGLPPSEQPLEEGAPSAALASVMPVTDAPPPRDAAVSADDLVRCSHSQPGSGQHLQPEILRMRRYYALLGLPLALLAACNTDRPDTPSAPSSPSAAA